MESSTIASIDPLREVERCMVYGLKVARGLRCVFFFATTKAISERDRDGEKKKNDDDCR